MREISLPQGYSSLLSVYETQKAIGLLKRLFADKLSGALRLHRVSAPLFVSAETGLNDDLNGVERPVSFDINGVKETAQVSTPWPSGSAWPSSAMTSSPARGFTPT